MQYLGHLAGNDPLRHYLQTEILPQFGQCGAEADFRVFRLGERHATWLYEERHSGLRVVGKFFARPYQPGTPATQQHMDREFDNLRLLESYGLAGYPHNVVRPLGRNAALSSVLIEEYISDPRLGQFFEAASRQGQHAALFARLTALAYFLASLHNRTANGLGVDFNEDGRYLNRLVGHLLAQGALCAGEAQEFYWLRDRWAEQPRMWADQQVWVHGDATPANFLMGGGLQVTAIDLERMKRADRVFDVGRIAGELQHAFLQATGDKYAAEPFIGHFLWEYACHFPDRLSAFRAICQRVPFQMALTLLRIARNHWISREHRQRLIEEARLTLADNLMDLRAILFDVNGTLIDIETDEGQDNLYRVISRFLSYQGLLLAPEAIRDRYFALMQQQRQASQEPFAEFDAVAIWQTLLAAESAAAGLPPGRLAQLPRPLAELHRALARKRLALYPDVLAVLSELRQRYSLGIVTDAQSAYAVPELNELGLGSAFACVIVSGDYGYRKPDRRLFEAALKALAVLPEQAIYVGNDMYHDVFGAQQVGLRTVFWPTQYGRKEHPGVAADYIIYSFAQLREAVTFLVNR